MIYMHFHVKQIMNILLVAQSVVRNILIREHFFRWMNDTIINWLLLPDTSWVCFCLVKQWYCIWNNLNVSIWRKCKLDTTFDGRNWIRDHVALSIYINVINIIKSSKGYERANPDGDLDCFLFRHVGLGSPRSLPPEVSDETGRVPSLGELRGLPCYCDCRSQLIW